MVESSAQKTNSALDNIQASDSAKRREDTTFRVRSINNTAMAKKQVIQQKLN